MHILDKTRVFVVAAMLILLGSCSDEATKSQNYLEAGKQYFEDGDLDRAGIEFRNALQIDPKNTEARYYIALLAEERQNFADAFRAFEALSLDDPGNAAVQAKLGQYYVGVRDLEKAREKVGLASEIDPSHPELLFLKGIIAYKDKKYDQAAEHARTALETRPSFVEASILLADVLRDNGEIESSLSTLDTAIARAQDASVLRTVKVRTLLDSDMHELAIEEMHKLASDNPGEYSYRRKLALILMKLDRQDEAEQVLRDAIAQRSGGNEPKFDLIDMIAGDQGEEQAVSELLTLIEAEPDEPPLRLRLAQLYANSGRDDKAEEVLRFVIDRDAINVHGSNARLALARLRLSHGEREAARILVNEVINVDPNNADALLLRASLTLEEDDPAGAVVDLRAILRNQPSATTALRLLEQAYLLSGQADLAEETLARTSELNPDDVSVLQRLANLRAHQGDREEALELTNRVLEDKPDATGALKLKAILLVSLGRWDDAEQAAMQLIKVPEEEVHGYLILGSLKNTLGKHNEAVDAYEAARAVDPTAFEAISGIAQSLIARDGLWPAIEFVKDIAREQPDNASAHNLAGVLLLRAEQAEDARTAFRKAAEVQVDWNVPYANLGLSLAAEGRFEDGIEAFNTGLQHIPNDPVLLSALAQAYEGSGQIDSAIAAYHRVLESDPDNARAINNLAALLADARADDPAALGKAHALALRLADSEQAAHLDTLGWVQYRLGRYEEARLNLMRAHQLLPDNPVVAYHLGLVLDALGEENEAREALERAIAGGADFPGFADARARLDAMLQPPAKP